MKVIYDTEKQHVPIKVFADYVEDAALEQAQNAARLPVTRGSVVLMPDVHSGYGLPVGGVLATKDAVVPYAIGNDIGCGMHARRTNIPAGLLTPELLRTALDLIQVAVPTGKTQHAGRQDEPPEVRATRNHMEQCLRRHAGVSHKVYARLQKAVGNSSHQLGTLGDGNHFFELQRDEEGFTWVMLHSGSRALGAAICDYFDELAAVRNAEWHTAPPQRRQQLAWLPTGSDEGQAYLTWMRAAMSWALANRRRILDRALDVLFKVARGIAPDDDYLVTEAVDCHHNYAVMEHHHGENVLVHRKGAVRAREGEMVIIPGSMETASYIARGKGNAESLTSAPHGAGRRLSRKKAQEARSAEDTLAGLAAAGVVIAKHNLEDVAQEAAHAYKGIDEVMTSAADLVEPVYRLTPMGVLNG